ncbi:hypothetical protein Pla108_25880 [Botrimarina colliarenosi]|uniref:4Fe-4S ferredoxin-type domain-containing protein n=1 Tax=Botrimarina colliarenosi TaxID=2528001 RepID=A0A5C6A9X6_9BACT|nr:hypothetical protein [Botrimarina colliarenosi]TWT96814.1 hypothetical protein Pla108_25880 [Botrimarina colliarenosi]
MNSPNQRFLLGLVALMAVVHLVGLGVTASAAPFCADKTNCPACCDGKSVCFATQEVGKEEKHCWCVECKEIAVPRVRCPWEPGGSPLTCFDWLKGRHSAACCSACGDKACGVCESCCHSGCCDRQTPCGEVKRVAVLTKKKYEVDVRQWKWEIRRLPPCCCAACGCGAGSGCGCVIDE